MTLMVGTSFVTGSACDDDPDTSSDGDGDSDADGDLDADSDSDGDEPDAETGLPSHASRALLLDHDLRHNSTWIDVIRSLENAELEVSYRRFYPHLTSADIEPDQDGQYPYSIIILGAGRTPGNPGSTMRFDEIELARQFVESGGALLMVPQSGYRDSLSGENDFFIFNRILEELDLRIRVDRDTVIGVVWYGEPSPPHNSYQWGYATPLEFVLGYPYLLTPEDERVAGGLLPTLRMDTDDAQVLLQTFDVGMRWVNLGGDPDDRILYIDEPMPTAALAQASEGYVAVVPRGPITLTSASSISDKPAADPDRRQVNLQWIEQLFQTLVGLVHGQEELEITETHEGDEIFSVASRAHLPLDDEAEPFMIGSGVNDLPVADAPPGATTEEVIPDTPTDTRPIPSWFSSGGGRLAYGGLTAERSAMADAFAEIVDHNVDVLMSTTNPVRLLGLEGAELDERIALYEEIAAMAEDAGARWIIGEHFVGPYLESSPREYPRMVGSHGGETDAPAPLNADYWENVLLPTCELVGEMAADNPGIAGYHLDLELYNGPVWHHDGWAFSDDTVNAFIEASGDSELGSQLLEARGQDRLDTLVDAGELQQYFDVLEGVTEAYATRCRTAIRDVAPHVDLMIYVAAFPNTWLYLGLLRGLSEPERPAIVLTYDGWANAASDALWAEGIPMVHLGGTIVSHFEPDDFEDVLVSLATGNDGYWYFTFEDFSSTNPAPPALHGSSTEYWSAVDSANSRLE